MEGILFVLITGCQWRALDATGICNGATAHRRFQEWAASGVFKRFWEEGLFEYDRVKGLKLEWLSMDGSITKAPLGGDATGPSPVDRAKIGTKRSLLVEEDGIPISVEIAEAGKPDFRMFPETVDVTPLGPESLDGCNMCLDKGYDYPEVDGLCWAFGFTAHTSRKGEDYPAAADAKHTAKRWVVERTFSWLNCFRALLIRWAKKGENYLAQLHLALGIITWEGLLR
jgi:transposase